MIESLESRQLLTLTFGSSDGLVPYVEQDNLRPAMLAPARLASNFEIQRQMSAYNQSETLAGRVFTKSSDTNTDDSLTQKIS